MFKPLNLNSQKNRGKYYLWYKKKVLTVLVDGLNLLNPGSISAVLYNPNIHDKTGDNALKARKMFTSICKKYFNYKWV